MLKRTFDIVISVTLLIFLSLLLIIIGLILFLKKEGGILFIQKRVGRNNAIFTLMKFRTMSDASDNQGRLLPDKYRITRFGKFLRDTSIDELPQLINVLRGDMSIVGPRPLPVSYLSLYSNQQARRHLVRPGITGWAQVNGRNSLDWLTKFDMDVWYVDNQSFILDLKILLRTIFIVLSRKGINASNSTTMPPFRGDLK